MSASRKVVVMVKTGVLVGAAAALVVSTGMGWSQQGAQRAGLNPTVRPVSERLDAPVASQWVCPGLAAHSKTKEGAAPGGPDSAGVSLVSAQAAFASAAPLSVKPLAVVNGPGVAQATSALGSPTVTGAVVSGSADQPFVVSMNRDGTNAEQNPTLVSAMVVGGVSDIELRAARCQVPSVDDWLVGGDTKVGHSTYLVLSNPSDTAATVSVDIHTPEGLSESAGTRSVTVAPATQYSLALEALAPKHSALAVHVKSAGAPVAAFLSDLGIDGLVSRGGDLVPAVAPAATTQLLSGVVVRQGLPTSLRIVVPGAQSASVSWRVVGDQGALSGAPGSVVVGAGQVRDIALPIAAPGLYAVDVTSTQPVLVSSASGVAPSSPTVSATAAPPATSTAPSTPTAVPTIGALPPPAGSPTPVGSPTLPGAPSATTAPANPADAAVVAMPATASDVVRTVSAVPLSAQNSSVGLVPLARDGSVPANLSRTLTLATAATVAGEGRAAVELATVDSSGVSSPWRTVNVDFKSVLTLDLKDVPAQAHSLLVRVRSGEVTGALVLRSGAGAAVVPISGSDSTGVRETQSVQVPSGGIWPRNDHPATADRVGED